MECACRQWGARRFRISLRDKELGGRKGNQKENQEGEPKKGTDKEEQGKKNQKETTC